MPNGERTPLTFAIRCRHERTGLTTFHRRFLPDLYEEITSSVSLVGLSTFVVHILGWGLREGVCVCFPWVYWLAIFPGKFQLEA